MQAGKLRDRVTFQRKKGVAAPQGSPSGETDAFGNPLPPTDEFGNVDAAFEDLFTVWADMLEHTGKERLAAGRIEAARTATIRVRRTVQTKTIAGSDRLLARGASWNILSVIRVGRDNAMIEFLCETGGAT